MKNPWVKHLAHFVDWFWRNVHYMFFLSLKVLFKEKCSLNNVQCLSFPSSAFWFAAPPQTDEKRLFSWSSDSSNGTLPTLSDMDLTSEVTWRSWRINVLIQSSASWTDPVFKILSQRPNRFASSASMDLHVKSISRAQFRPTKLTWKKCKRVLSNKLNWIG